MRVKPTLSVDYHGDSVISVARPNSNRQGREGREGLIGVSLDFNRNTAPANQTAAAIERPARQGTDEIRG